MLITLHVYGPVFRCGSEEHGRPRIHIDGGITGGDVTIVIDEPSLACLREAVDKAAHGDDVEVDNRRLIDLGRRYERMLETGQIRADQSTGTDRPS
jgi:hypothetical protein